MSRQSASFQMRVSSGQHFESRPPSEHRSASTPHKGVLLQTQQRAGGPIETSPSFPQDGALPGGGSLDLLEEGAQAQANRELVENRSSPREEPRSSPGRAHGSIDCSGQDAGSTARRFLADYSLLEEQDLDQTPASGTGRGSRGDDGEREALRAQEGSSPHGSDASSSPRGQVLGSSPLESENDDSSHDESSEGRGESDGVGCEGRVASTHGDSSEWKGDAGQDAVATRPPTTKENDTTKQNGDDGAAVGGEPPRLEGGAVVVVAHAVKAVVEIDVPAVAASSAPIPLSIPIVEGTHPVSPSHLAGGTPAELSGGTAAGPGRRKEAQTREPGPPSAAPLQSGAPITPPTPLSMEDAAWLAGCVPLAPTPALNMPSTVAGTAVQGPHSSTSLMHVSAEYRTHDCGPFARVRPLHPVHRAES